MRYLITLLFTILLGATAADAGVGFQLLSVRDPGHAPIEVGVWYPTDAKPKRERIELDSQAVARDAAVKGRALPLIMISHGHGGSYSGHADTAIALAQAGFVAAAPTHTGDNWRDISGATAVWERSRQFKVVTDYLLARWRDHARIDPRRIGAFGFSAGGFTVLTSAGGRPDLTRFAAHCRAHPDFEDCRIAGDDPVDPARTIRWTADPRIRAIVSAAPALGFAFGREGLAGLRVPVQLWRAADDRVLIDPHYAEAVRIALPRPPENHVVARAGHYDFLAPCSAALAREVPAICTSAAGFDRRAFHVRFNRDVIAFFRRTLR